MPSDRVTALIKLLDAHEGDPISVDFQKAIRELSIEELKEVGQIMLARAEAARARSKMARASDSHQG